MSHADKAGLLDMSNFLCEMWSVTTKEERKAFQVLCLNALEPIGVRIPAGRSSSPVKFLALSIHTIGMQAKSLFKITLYEGFLLVRNFVLQNSKLYLPLLQPLPNAHACACKRDVWLPQWISKLFLSSYLMNISSIQMKKNIYIVSEYSPTQKHNG